MDQPQSDCRCEFHPPAFVERDGVSCSTYSTWLDRLALSAHRRLPVPRKWQPAEVKRRLHKAVHRSGGVDFYTGEPILWRFLSDPPSTSAGRAEHCRRGLWPSVDHYTGTKALDFRICSGQVNVSKGALSHQHFVALCRRVVDHDESRRRASERAPLMSRPCSSQPTAPSPLNRSISSIDSPASVSAESVSVAAGRVARGAAVGVAE